MAATELASKRFRGFLPVVVDVETGGFFARTDALLEIAAVIVEIDTTGRLRRGITHSFHV
jgi:ribonuclease T